MSPDEIRQLNADCQAKGLKSGNTAAHEAALKSLHLDLLAEIAAQLAQLNNGLETLTSANYLRVQVEPGQYPIVVEEKK
jgi:hypothetical protein